MNPRWRARLAGLLGAGIGVVGAVGLAQENYLLAILCSAVILWVVAEWFGGPLPDAWLLAGALFGYIVGNRGFAQLQLVGGVPLFPAEAVLLVAVPVLLVRLAQKRAHAFLHDPLNYAVALWFLLGLARLPLDFPRHGFFAVRDFATVYYAAFFFIGQAFARHEPSARLLRRSLTAACLALPFLATAFRFFPDFFLGTLTLRGAPLIYFKDDLLATLFAAAFFWLWARGELSGRRLWWVPAAACLLLIGTTTSPRAAMVAVAGVTAIWLLARRWRIAAAQVALVGVAGLGTALVFSVGGEDFRRTTAYSAYEHAVSIFDYEAKGRYVNRTSGDPGDNNRFRLVWWRAVVDETLEENPVFGLGFGHDLAARFLADYGLVGADDFTARSPHSIVLTILGRMGLAGLVGWLAIAWGMALMTRRVFRQGAADGRGLVSLAWVIWISACFGVVLEGPMGAVVFWTVLGLANAAPSVSPAAAAESDIQTLTPASPALLPSVRQTVSLSPASIAPPFTPPPARP